MKQNGFYCIATVHDLKSNPEHVVAAIKAGQDVRTWSVQNESRSNSIFNGTYDECVAYIQEHDNDSYIGLAQVSLDADLSPNHTHKFVDCEDLCGDAVLVTRNQYITMVTEMREYSDPDAYASEMAMSLIAEADDDSAISTMAFVSRQFWDVCHLNLKGIAEAAGMSVRAMVMRYSIPYRTAVHWMANEDSDNYRPCPIYIRLMLVELLGLLPFRIAKR